MFDRLFAQGGLSLDRVRVLVEIAEAGSIAAAAGDDSVRQSQYSRQMRELAEFFGVELARRSGRTIKLTAEGTRLAELGRETLRSLDDFWCDSRARTEEFTLGGGDSVLQWLVTPALSRARRTGKGPAFRLCNLRTADTVSRLQDLSLDIGFVRTDAVPRGLEQCVAGRLDYVLIVPAALLPRRATVELAWCLQNLPIAAQMSDGQFTRRLREIGDTHSAPINVALACESFTQAFTALRTNEFAAVLPKLVVADLDARHFRALESKAFAPLTREIAMAWNPRLTRVRPRARIVIDALRTSLTN